MWLISLIQHTKLPGNQKVCMKTIDNPKLPKALMKWTAKGAWGQANKSLMPMLEILQDIYIWWNLQYWTAISSRWNYWLNRIQEWVRFLKFCCICTHWRASSYENKLKDQFSDDELSPSKRQWIQKQENISIRAQGSVGLTPQKWKSFLICILVLFQDPFLVKAWSCHWRRFVGLFQTGSRLSSL